MNEDQSWDNVEPQTLASNGTVPSSFSGRLTLPATGPEIAEFIAFRAAACVGAAHSTLALLTQAGDSLRLFHNPFLDTQIATRYTDVPLDAPFPISAAVRERRVVLLPDLAAYEAEFPVIVADTIAAEIQATASLPLYRSDGSVLGAIGFAWKVPTQFDAKLEAALQAVAHLCVATVERAERYDTDHELVNALQERLLSELPTLPGTDIAAKYVSAGTLGGDWYEGLLLDDGKIAVVVGDVVGHGVSAIADMALIRGMMSALLHSHVPTSEIFTEVTGVLNQRDEPLYATAALAVIDVPECTLTYTTAGHPPPLLRLPDGTISKLDSANGMMIGVGSELAGTVETVPFPIGSQLLMYTDGLVERHDRPISAGIDLAAAQLASSPQQAPDQAVESLLEALSEDGPGRDDVAVLLLEHVGH